MVWPLKNYRSILIQLAHHQDSYLIVHLLCSCYRRRALARIALQILLVHSYLSMHCQIRLHICHLTTGSLSNQSHRQNYRHICCPLHLCYVSYPRCSNMRTSARTECMFTGGNQNALTQKSFDLSPNRKVGNQRRRSRSRVQKLVSLNLLPSRNLVPQPVVKTNVSQGPVFLPQISQSRTNR